MAPKRAPKKTPAKIPAKTAERIVAIALQNPELGARRLVPLLKKKRISVSASGVQRILRGHNLQTRALRLAKIKAKRRKPKTKQQKPAGRITAGLADRIVKLSLKNPHWGARRLARALAQKKVAVSPSRVYAVLKRNDLQTRQKRKANLKAPAKKTRRPKASSQKPATKINDQIAARICEIALQNPELGAKRLVPLLEEQEIFATSSAVYRVFKCNGVENRSKRLLKLKEKMISETSPEFEIELPEPVDVPAHLAPMPPEDEIPESLQDFEIELPEPVDVPAHLAPMPPENEIPESLQDFEIELPEPVDVPAHLAPMPPEDEIPEFLQDQEELPSLPIEDEIPEFLQDQEELPSLPIEDEIWEHVLEPVELAPVPDQDEIPEPLPGPAEDEITEPVFEPAATAPIPPEVEAPAPVEEPEPLPERVETTAAEPEPPPVRTALLKLPRKKSHWIFYPLYLLLLLLIGYLGFQSLQAIQFARPEADTVTASGSAGERPAVQPRASIRPLSDYQVIWQRNLFNVTLSKDSDKKDEISLENIALAKKDLGLELVGTVVAEDSNLSRAIIDNRKTREQEAYREGDSAGKVKIKKILRNNVIITTAKGDELLTVEIKESAKGSASSVRSKSIGSHASSSPQKSDSAQSNARSTRSRARTRSIKLKRDEVEASLANVDDLMEKVNVTPYMQGDQPSGFRISNIPADSVLRKMGLRSRDVIVGVDEDDITGPDQATDFFEKLAAGEEVTIRVKRRRRTRQIKLSIE